MTTTEISEALKKAGSDRSALALSVKERLHNKHDELKRAHLKGATGKEVVASYSSYVDELLCALFEVVGSGHEDIGEISLVAMGGYGREELNIHSDIDLMLLFDKAISDDLEELTEQMLYALWDSGLDVGFAIRSVGECLELARGDLKTMTSQLDVRFLAGSRALFDKLVEKTRKRLLGARSRKKFIEDKLEETEERHERYGGSVYILEPNLKEGEGGLRDFHTARWVAIAFFGSYEPIKDSLLTDTEAQTLDVATDFLLRVRNELHFASKRKNDQLTFDEQERIAVALGYKPTKGHLAVEAFMQYYYRQAYEINRLSKLVISRVLHKSSRKKIIKRKRTIDEDFVITNGKLSVKSDLLFETKPEAMIKAFEHSQSRKVPIGQRTKDLILENVHCIDDSLRSSGEVAESFKKILRGEGVFEVLGEMHSLEFLDNYIPEFGKITCRMQHDLYHVYTIDTHTLFAVREIERLRTSSDKELAHLTDILREIEKPEVLILAILLHDIGKALGKGHAEKGAALVAGICSRLSMGEDDAELVEFLVRNHLILADTAQYRDLHDDKLIIEFAKRVSSTERLDLLYLLTFADVKAVGPEVWSQWKGALFKELYVNVRKVIEQGSFVPEDAEARLEAKKQKVLELIGEGESKSDVDEYFELLYTNYYLANSSQDILNHMRTHKSIGDKPLAMTVTQVEERAYTELIVCSHDVHGLFSMITGVLAVNSVNILGAQINTMKNGMALDVLQVKNVYGRLFKDKSKLKKISADLESVITGKVKVSSLLKKKRRARSVLDDKHLPKIPPRVRIDNDVSEDYTVVEIYTRDRLGLLYTVSSELTRLGLFIHIAKVTTKGGEAADIFYVKDIFGQKIFYKERLKEIIDSVFEVISEGSDEAKKSGK